MIYVLEDDESIRELIIYTLNGQKMEAKGFSTPSEFWEAISEKVPSLVLLDIMLPEEDGFSILEKLRAAPATKRLPIIMLTARGEDIDRILGLEMGADEYIVKPFSPREVVSRIKAVLRRTCAAPDTAQEEKLTTLTFGSLEIQPERYSVKLAGQSIACTPREVELLYLLASHPGRVFDREQILSRIWGYDFFGDTRTVDTHIKRLRQKLSCDEMGQKWDIITVYGVGYKFEAEA